MPSFPLRFDTMITVHLKEKLSPRYSSIHPSVVFTMYQELFCDHVLPLIPLVYPLVSSTSVIDFLLILTGRGVLSTSVGRGAAPSQATPKYPPVLSAYSNNGQKSVAECLYCALNHTFH